MKDLIERLMADPRGAYGGLRRAAAAEIEFMKDEWREDCREYEAEIERLQAVVDAARAIDEWLHADMESENLGCLSCLHDNLSAALAGLEDSMELSRNDAKEIGSYREGTGLRGSYREQQAEIERLQGRIDALHEHDGTMCPICAMENEIERLRHIELAANAFIDWFINGPNKGMDVCWGDPEVQQFLEALNVAYFDLSAGTISGEIGQ